jgi:hypothetical protein
MQTFACVSLIGVVSAVVLPDRRRARYPLLRAVSLRESVAEVRRRALMVSGVVAA